MIPGFLTVLIAISVLAVFLCAFTGQREVWDLDEGPDLLSRLKRKKDRTLRVIKDLREEHARGSIEDAEFEALVKRYSTEAKRLIQELYRVRAVRMRQVAAGSIASTAIPAASRSRVEREVARVKRERG